jgi:2-dehydropantoate 2-reductase
MASIYILGAGAMGSLWATHLHQAYQQKPFNSVQFLSTRTNIPEKISFSLTSPFLSATQTTFDTQLSLVKSSQLNKATPDNPNIILICTKSYHALEACLSLKPFLNEHSYLVLFQNGLGSQHQIIDELKGLPIYAAVSTEGVNRQENGNLVHAGKGLTRIGPLNDLAKETLEFKNCIAALSHPGLDIEAHDNIWQALWEKLAINCAINPFTAILNCPNGEIKDSAFFQENWPHLKIELTEMLNAAGVKITSTELEAKVLQVIENTRTNISSMLQDVRANRKTEIEDINGFAASYLKENSLINKVNSMLEKLSQL